MISPEAFKDLTSKGPNYSKSIRDLYPPIPPRNRDNGRVGENNSCSKLTNESVYYIINLYLNTFLSLPEIALNIKEVFNIDVDSDVIHKVIRGKTWKCITFQYASALEARRLERKEKRL